MCTSNKVTRLSALMSQTGSISGMSGVPYLTTKSPASSCTAALAARLLAMRWAKLSG